MSSAFVDFAELKTRVTIAQVVQMLGLQMKSAGEQMRGACPQCKTGGDRALAVNTAKGSYYCFSAKAGGDLIALCAHVRELSQRDAAQAIASHFRLADSATSPSQHPPAPQEEGALKPLDYLVYNEAVEAVGFDKEMAEAVGIGFAPKGIMRNTVAIPIRLQDGTLIGYIGIEDARLPSKWHLPSSNIVPLKQKA